MPKSTMLKIEKDTRSPEPNSDPTQEVGADGNDPQEASVWATPGGFPGATLFGPVDTGPGLAGPALAEMLERCEMLIGQTVASFRRQAGRGVVDADDLRQEARLQTIDLLRDYRPERNGNLEAYLRTKLRWRVANYLRAERRRGRAVPLDEETIRHPSAELQTSLHAGFENPRLAGALRRLSPRQRAVIARIYGQERATRQIAAELGVSPQAVTALRRRAEASLKRDLE